MLEKDLNSLSDMKDLIDAGHCSLEYIATALNNALKETARKNGVNLYREFRVVPKIEGDGGQELSLLITTPEVIEKKNQLEKYRWTDDGKIVWSYMKLGDRRMVREPNAGEDFLFEKDDFILLLEEARKLVVNTFAPI